MRTITSSDILAGRLGEGAKIALLAQRARDAGARLETAPHKPADRPNKTEYAYAARLAVLQRAGEIREFAFEAVKLTLAPRTTYTPDFRVTLRDGTVELHEIKACWKNGRPHWEDDARVKYKVAKSMFPQYTFRAYARSRDGSFKEIK